MTRSRQLRNSSGASFSLLLIVALFTPVADASMLWFQRNSSEWFYRNNDQNYVPVDSYSYFNEFFDDTTSSTVFSEQHVNFLSEPSLPVDIRVDLAAPVDAISIKHRIRDLLELFGAVVEFSLVYEFFDVAGDSLGMLSIGDGNPDPELVDIIEIEVPRILVDQPSVERECRRPNGRRQCYIPETTDAGNVGTMEADPPEPSLYSGSIEYGFASLGEPIASLALRGNLNLPFGNTLVVLTGKAGVYDLEGFAETSGFALEPPSAVPLPASVWLLATALAGLFGFARRKS